jgi:hypothetical protein
VVVAGADRCGDQRWTRAAAGRRRHACGVHARARWRGMRGTAGADTARADVAGAQVTSVMRQAARRAVAAAGPRLVEAMLLCEVAAAAEALAGAPWQDRVGSRSGYYTPTNPTLHCTSEISARRGGLSGQGCYACSLLSIAGEPARTRELSDREACTWAKRLAWPLACRGGRRLRVLRTARRPA